MAGTALEHARTLLTGRSPIPGYIAPSWNKTTPLAHWLVAADVLGHYLGDVTNGLRTATPLPAPDAADAATASAPGYLLHAHGPSVTIDDVMSLVRQEGSRAAVGQVEVHAVKLGPSTMLLVRANGAPGAGTVTDPVAYWNGRTPYPLWTLVPTEQRAVPQSATHDQLLSALMAIQSPTCVAAIPFLEKGDTNRNYTLCALAGLGLIVARGNHSTLTAAGRALLADGPELAAQRLAALVDTSGLVQAFRDGGPAAVDHLLAKLDFGGAMHTRLGVSTLKRRLSDINRLAQWADGLRRGGTPTAAAPLTRATVTPLPGQAADKAAAADLLKRMHEMDPIHFERLVAHVAAAHGFADIEFTKRSGDNGVDVRATHTVDGSTRNVVIQAKRQRGRVGSRVLRELRGTGRTGDIRILVTTASFSKAARDNCLEDPDRPVELVNGAMLAALCVKHGIGVEQVGRSYELTDLTEFAA